MRRASRGFGSAICGQAPLRPAVLLHAARCMFIGFESAHKHRMGSKLAHEAPQCLRSSETAENEHRHMFSRGGRDLTVARDAADAAVRRMCVALPRSIAVACPAHPPVNNMTRPVGEAA